MPFAGITRSAISSDHALIAPDSNVKSALPGWKSTMGIILISPQLGAGFLQYEALMEKGGTSGEPQAGVQRLFYVREGSVQVIAGGAKKTLTAGGYGYVPAHEEHSIKALKASRLLIFEKDFVPLEGEALPEIVLGQEQDVTGAPFLGDSDAVLQVLLPDHPRFDMAINIFTYNPGATLPFVETHVMEHGLMMLAGQGVYRLSDSWYIVGEGDVIWMAPYCAQWFVASGKKQARYIYYKDVQRDPLQAF